MAAPCFIAYNGAMPTTARIPSVTTGTAIKTMLQLKAQNGKLRIVEWGYSFDTVPTAVVNVELIDTSTVGCTMATAYAAADVMKYNDSTGAATNNVLTGGANASVTSGFTSNGTEGTITASRVLSFNEEWGQSFKQQFPLGREPEVNSGDYLRIRVTTATALNMLCYVVWEE